MKNLNRIFSRWFLIPVTLLVLTACSLGPVEYGVLEGQVSIGPLVPVVREGEEAPTPAPEVYAARQIVVSKTNSRVVALLEIDASGGFRAELPAGVYLIDINRIGIDSAKGLPLEVEILPEAVFWLAIEIDTGIR